MSLQSSIIANLASVQADMNYLAPMLERPRNYTFEPPPGISRRAVFELAHRLRVERGDYAIGQEHLQDAIAQLEAAPVR